LLSRQRDDLLRFRADLDSAGREWRVEAQHRFQPATPTDLAGVRFAAVEQWVEELVGPVAEPPDKPLANGPHWQEWDRGRMKEALRAHAVEDVAPFRPGIAQGMKVDEPVVDEARLTALARLSQPLVPVNGWAYDSQPQHVFQRWVVPTDTSDPWREVVLPSGEAACPCDVAWPTVVTVYRDLPLAVLARVPHK